MTIKSKLGPSENHMNVYALLKNNHIKMRGGKAYSNNVFVIILEVREIYMSKVKCYSFEKAVHYSRYLPKEGKRTERGRSIVRDPTHVRHSVKTITQRL